MTSLAWPPPTDLGSWWDINLRWESLSPPSFPTNTHPISRTQSTITDPTDVAHNRHQLASPFTKKE